MNKKLVYVVVALFVILLLVSLVIVGFLLAKSDGDIGKIAKNIDMGSLNPNGCTKENTTFTAAPVDVEDLSNIVPLGNLNPSGHTFPTVHMYYFMKKEDPDDFNSVSRLTNVYAPIDAKIESMNVMTRTDVDPDSTDFSINFRTCEDFTFYFIHVTSLTEKYQQIVDEMEMSDCNEYSTGGRDFKNCWINELDIEVEAGELLGTAAGGVDKSALDFGVTDFRIEPHEFANPDRWVDNRDDMPYKVCSTDYYEGELKQILESKLGGFDDLPRTIEPICGTNAQDVPGTAQGIWFLKGTVEAGSEDLHIALVHDNFDPRIGVFSNGISMEEIGISSGTYRFDPEQTGNVNLDFSLVRPGSEVYCYEVGGSFHSQDNSFVILIQLVTEEAIKIGKWDFSECGTGPWSLGEFVEFER